MKQPCFLRPQADRYIDEISDELVVRAGFELALSFLEDFAVNCGLLSEQAEMGWPANLRHPKLRGTRTVRVSGRFDRYLIFYLVPGKRIEIIRVVHGARDLDALFPDRE